MQSFFIAFAQLLSTIWEYIQNMYNAFFSLLDYLYSSIAFVLNSLTRLPDIVRVPCSIILGVMVIKFILSFGKQ